MIVYYRGSRADVRRLVELVNAIAAGRAADPFGVAQAVQARLGVALLSKIQQAFVVKSRGGTGQDGIKWKPLAASTIARRRKKGVGGTDILRDTGLLLRSFSPGVDNVPGGEAFSVFEARPGEVTVGTNRYPWHHTGTGRCAARPFWPPDGRLPAAWWQAVASAGGRGVVQVLLTLLSSGFRPPA